MVLDMGEEDDVHLILRRLFLHTTSAIIYMKQGEMHFHFPREKVRCYFNSYTTYEKPKKNRNRRRRSQHLRQQAIKEEEADQKKEAVEEEAALEVKEEEKLLDKEPQKQKTKKVWRKKEITPLSTRRRIDISQLTRYSGTTSRGEIRGGLCPLRHPLKCVIKPEGPVQRT
jgi:hypothetical protein